MSMENNEADYLLHSVFMYLNPYGNEAINSWDGTTVEIDDKGGTILAPQIGAGTKNTANQFSGVVMGKDSTQDKTGLYGYKDGINTFALTEDGKASFGTKDQITINGEHAQITGKNSGADDGQYMTINLVNMGNGTYAIHIGDKFLVDYEGNLVCTGATVTGTITATAGTIGGCNIDNGVLKIAEANISGKLTANVIDGSELNVNSANIADSVNANWVYAGNINADNISGGTLDFSKLGAEGSNAIKNLTWNMVQYASKNASIDGIGSSTNRLAYLYGTEAGFTGDVTCSKTLSANTLRFGGWYLGSAGVREDVTGAWVSWSDIIKGSTSETKTAVFG